MVVMNDDDMWQAMGWAVAMLTAALGKPSLQSSTAESPLAPRPMSGAAWMLYGKHNGIRLTLDRLKRIWVMEAWCTGRGHVMIEMTAAEANPEMIQYACRLINFPGWNGAVK